MQRAVSFGKAKVIDRSARDPPHGFAVFLGRSHTKTLRFNCATWKRSVAIHDEARALLLAYIVATRTRHVIVPWHKRLHQTHKKIESMGIPNPQSIVRRHYLEGSSGCIFEPGQKGTTGLGHDPHLGASRKACHGCLASGHPTHEPGVASPRFDVETRCHKQPLKTSEACLDLPVFDRTLSPNKIGRFFKMGLGVPFSFDRFSSCRLMERQVRLALSLSSLARSDMLPRKSTTPSHPLRQDF